MASSSLARPMAREMASFIAATCRRMVWPTEATDCSASRSGSASLTATSVMAEAMRRSSCARQTSSARNQKMTMGTRMATAAVSAEALPTRPETPPELTWAEIRPKAKKPPMMNQATEAASAIRNGRARRPLLEREDQAADRRHVVIGGCGETALRRRPGRPARPDELLRRRRWRALALGLARRFGEFERRSSALPLVAGRLFRRLGRLLASRLGDAFALALLGLEPFRQ